ncbi:hypothetical protein [Anditalea andensis]|uniref:Outer membrane protein beta-barrel domain-containing protein n=1 Tax=Anditalea andensis TaxID=1048983 RepID=A0A074KPM7_9BACT|nr:hypothetical protein [Anditalea andensis]KEO71911.1 hypothetical protein EL17_20560 [Anditalea andensis]
MRKNLMIIMAFMPFLTAYAQDDKTVTAVAFHVTNSYQWPGQNTGIHSFYGLGGHINVYLNDRYYVGFSQMGSLAPSDLLKAGDLSPEKLRLYEYTLNAGLKFNLGSNLYMRTGLNGGVALVSVGETQKIDGINEFKSRYRTEYIVLSPQINFGLPVNRYFSVEAGAAHKWYLGDKTLNGIRAGDFNGFAVSLSLVGRLPFD